MLSYKLIALATIAIALVTLIQISGSTLVDDGDGATSIKSHISTEFRRFNKRAADDDSSKHKKKKKGSTTEAPESTTTGAPDAATKSKPSSRRPDGASSTGSPKTTPASGSSGKPSTSSGPSSTGKPGTTFGPDKPTSTTFGPKSTTTGSPTKSPSTVTPVPTGKPVTLSPDTDEIWQVRQDYERKILNRIYEALNEWSRFLKLYNRPMNRRAAHKVFRMFVKIQQQLIYPMSRNQGKTSRNVWRTKLED